MATKTVEVKVPVPVEITHAALLGISNELKDWENIESNIKTYTFIWKWGWGLKDSPGKITIVLRSLSDSETLVNITVENMALIDSFGVLDGKIKRIVEPLITHATLIWVGLKCPTCGRAIPEGTRFCPNDGTAITRNCTACGRANAPDSKFCSNCGMKFQ